METQGPWRNFSKYDERQRRQALEEGPKPVRRYARKSHEVQIGQGLRGSVPAAEYNVQWVYEESPSHASHGQLLSISTLQLPALVAGEDISELIPKQYDYWLIGPDGVGSIHSVGRPLESIPPEPTSEQIAAYREKWTQTMQQKEYIQLQTRS